MHWFLQKYSTKFKDSEFLFKHATPKAISVYNAKYQSLK